MAGVCGSKITADTRIIISNPCLPEAFRGEIDITDYVEGDIVATQTDTTVTGIKANSEVNENYGQTYSEMLTLMVKLQTNTYISQYFRAIQVAKKYIGMSIVNNFTVTIITPYDTTIYANTYMQLPEIPLENIVSKEYVINPVLYFNTKGIIAANPNVEVIDNPQDVDANLQVELNAVDDTIFDFSFETTANSINFAACKIVAINTTTQEAKEFVFTTGESGTYSTEPGVLDNAENYTFTLSAPELGYNQEYKIGETTYTPAP